MSPTKDRAKVEELSELVLCLQDELTAHTEMLEGASRQIRAMQQALQETMAGAALQIEGAMKACRATSKRAAILERRISQLERDKNG